MTQRLRTLLIVWGAMVFFSVVMAVVAWLAPKQPAEQIFAMLPALAVVGVICAVMSFVYPTWLLRGGLGRLQLELADEPDPDVMPGFYRDGAPTRRVFAEPKKAGSRAMAQYFTAVILRSALRESIVIYGLVLALVGFSLLETIGFFVMGIGLLLVGRPNINEVVGQLERVYDAVLPHEQLE